MSREDGVPRFALLWPIYRPALYAGLLGLALGALVAFAVSLVQEPVYVAATSVSLRPRVANLGTAEAADRLGANLAAWAVSETYVSRLTPQELGGYAPRDAAARIKARELPKQMIVLIEGRDADPSKAAGLANGVARVLVEDAAATLFAGQPSESLAIERMDPALPPSKASSPRPEIVVPVGAVLGLAAGVALASLYGWLSAPVQPRRIARSQEVTNDR